MAEDFLPVLSGVDDTRTFNELPRYDFFVTLRFFLVLLRVSCEVRNMVFFMVLSVCLYCIIFSVTDINSRVISEVFPLDGRQVGCG